MTPTPEVQERLRRYLLGQVGGEAREEIEQDLLVKDELFEELLVVEDEIIDAYLCGELKGDERAHFEQHFLTTPERQDKLRFGRAFNRHLSEKAQRAGVIAASTRPAGARGWTQPLFSSPWRVAVLAVIFVGIVIGAWRLWFHNPEVDNGLMALNAAYREQRPIESRISAFDYAPYRELRGDEAPKVDQDKLRLAEVTLLAALAKNRTPVALHRLGELYLAKRDFDQAIQKFDEALEGDPRNAQLYNDLGAAWLEKGKAETDKTGGKSAEELARAHNNLNKALEINPGLLEALFNRAFARQRLRLTSQAAEDWRNYLTRDPSSSWAGEARRNLKILEDQLHQSAREADGLFQDFIAAYQTKDAAAAWAAFRLSRTRTGNVIVEEILDEYLAQSTAGQNAAAEPLLLLSYAGKVEYERAADRYTTDLARFYNRTNGVNRQTLVTARLFKREADALYNIGEFDKAAKLYAEAKSFFQRSGDECEALLADSLLGYCIVRNSESASASELFEGLSKSFTRRQYLSLASQAFNAAGDAESSRLEFSRTADFANRSLRLARQIDDSTTAVRCLTQLLSTYVTVGDYRRSFQYFEQAIATAEQLPREPKLIWPIYYDAGLAFHFVGLTETATGFEQEALNLAIEANVPSLRSRSWERLGILRGEQRKYDEAIDNGLRALAESYKISSTRSKAVMLAHSQLRLGQLHNQAGKPRDALSYFEQAIASYQKLESQAYSYEAEKGRLISHLQLNDDAAVQAELPRVISLYEENREKLVDESDRNKFFDAGQGTYDLAIDFAYRKIGAEQALAYAESSRARSLFDLMRRGARLSPAGDQLLIKFGAESKSMSPSEIRAQLPEKSQLLEYSVLDDKIIIWVITRDSIQSEYRPASAPELETRIHNFVYDLSHPSPEKRAVIRQQAVDFYAQLIAPVQKYLRPELLLTIIPDQSLNYLPFQALLSPTTEHYLVEDYTLERAPSATVFIESSLQAGKLERVSAEKLLSIGNPRFDRTQFGSLPDLPAAAREAERVASFYAPESHLVGDEATYGRVMRGFQDANVIHLATHALADERSPLLSKLLLTPEVNGTAGAHGVLRAADVYQMKLRRTRLVVLSACSTGIEHAYRGEGAVSLARPFVVAGVPLVVASLWPVESNATTDFMINFHRYRKDKKDSKSTVAALRLAQLDAIHNPTEPLNFGWAAFVAIGGYAEF